VVTDAARRPAAPGTTLDRLSVGTALALIVEVVLSVIVDTSDSGVALVVALAFAPVPLVLAWRLMRGLRRDPTVPPGRRAAAWTIGILTIGVIVLPIIGMAVLYVLLTFAPAGSS
jgi:hypothetical protein